LFLGGVGSGKTHVGGIISGYYIENFPNASGFIGANTFAQLSESTLKRFKAVWFEVFGWKQDVDYVVGIIPPKNFIRQQIKFDSYTNVISFKNGAFCYKGSMDNAKAHDGKQFSWAFLDETKDTKEEDVKDVILTRLREVSMYFSEKGKLITREEVLSLVGENTYELDGNKIIDIYTLKEIKPFNPLYILTSPAKVSWINEWFGLDKMQGEIESKIYEKGDYFVHQSDNKCVVVSNTYHNEINLPAGYIERIIAENYNFKMLIYANPFSKSGGEFYSAWERLKHVGEVWYDPRLPIHLTFDQNVTPYVTMNVWQIEYKEDIELRQIDEFCLPNPRNTTERVCLAWIDKYENHNAGVFFYGDPSGRKRDTRGNEDDYQIVERVLAKYLNNNSNKVRRKHPPVLKRRAFIDNVFSNRYKVRVLISPNCLNTIKDYTYIKQDANGKKLKVLVKDKETGQTYEEYGHTSDANDYFMCEVLDNLFSRFSGE
jgi:hypothetical protein